MAIIKVTAFCSNKTCCPTAEVNTDNNTVTITDDFEGTVTMERGVFLSANFFARKLNEKRLGVSVSATIREAAYSIRIENRDEVYYLSLMHDNQTVKDITLDQWNILTDAVYKSYKPSFILDEELAYA